MMNKSDDELLDSILVGLADVGLSVVNTEDSTVVDNMLSMGESTADDDIEAIVVDWSIEDDEDVVDDVVDTTLFEVVVTTFELGIDVVFNVVVTALADVVAFEVGLVVNIVSVGDTDVDVVATVGGTGVVVATVGGTVVVVATVGAVVVVVTVGGAVVVVVVVVTVGGAVVVVVDVVGTGVGAIVVVVDVVGTGVGADVKHLLLLRPQLHCVAQYAKQLRSGCVSYA
eukprot:CAMPEP_0168589934 /NCGR_PEP_ID=MMETSP0420-20121227/6284_1 /TAXON_ID=498008 /ORGANISM="Pessonella sp." /LENGTH=226 /DNA_ID=CAMNT_0008625529 /DNA_START=70 /DNA_END=750 /DNA_ORIENTATION=+